MSDDVGLRCRRRHAAAPRERPGGRRPSNDRRRALAGRRAHSRSPQRRRRLGGHPVRPAPAPALACARRDRWLGAFSTPSGEDLRRSTDNGRTRGAPSPAARSTSRRCLAHRPASASPPARCTLGRSCLRAWTAAGQYRPLRSLLSRARPCRPSPPRATWPSHVPGRPPAWRSEPVPPARWRRPPRADPGRKSGGSVPPGGDLRQCLHARAGTLLPLRRERRRPRPAGAVLELDHGPWSVARQRQQAPRRRGVCRAGGRARGATAGRPIAGNGDPGRGMGPLDLRVMRRIRPV